MSNTSLLIIKNLENGKEKKYNVKDAVFKITIETEKWDEASKLWKYGIEFLTVRYSVKLQIENGSGDDEEVEPVLNNIPIYKFFNLHHPLPNELVSKTIDIPEEKWDWDAWLGNDAPKLIENKLTFKNWDKGEFALNWEGKTEDESEILSYEGKCRFFGVSLTVKQEGDEDMFIGHLYKNSLADWQKKIGKRIEYDESMPEDRRKWLEIIFLPKNLS